MTERTARVLTFLAPNMRPVYEAVVAYVSQKLHYPMELVGADFSFLCALPYVLRTAPRLKASPIRAMVPPVLQGERHLGKPIYFSDVIVRRDSSLQSFADLRGHSWTFNEPESQSGYGITRYSLVKLDETKGYFSEVMEAAFHQKAIRIVAEGQVDAAAIDSLVLTVELPDQPELAQALRVIDTPGSFDYLTARGGHSR